MHINKLNFNLIHLLSVGIISTAQAMDKIRKTDERMRGKGGGGGGDSVPLYILEIALSDGPHKYKSVVRRIPTGVTRTECVSHWCDGDRVCITLVFLFFFLSEEKRECIYARCVGLGRSNTH